MTMPIIEVPADLLCEAYVALCYRVEALKITAKDGVREIDRALAVHDLARASGAQERIYAMLPREEELAA